jgi:hypothetical protein
MFPGNAFSRNAIIGAASTLYPADNYFATSVSAVGFVDVSGGNYRLATTRPYTTPPPTERRSAPTSTRS